MYTYVLVHTGMYWSVRWCTSTYCYILVCTSIYQYVFCGCHDMVQGSTAPIMKCHDIVHTDRYRHILTCTEKRQVYRILRDLALYWHVLPKNTYILVCTSVQVSTMPFPLESYTPDACRYRSVLVGLYYIMTFDDMVYTGMYHVMAPRI